MEEKLRVPSVTGVDVELAIAGPGGRSYAFVIDWHIRALIAFAWALGGSYLYWGSFTFPDRGDGLTGYSFSVLLPAAVIYFLYHPVLEVVMKGRTPGKRMAGVRIVTNDGMTPDIGAILIRNAFRLIDHLPLFYVVGLTATLCTQRAVRVGDMAAGTLLVYDDPAPESGGLHAIGAKAVARLGLTRAELIRDVLDRWDGLEPASRARLAKAILAPLDPALPEQSDEGLLRQRLIALLD